MRLDVRFRKNIAADHYSSKTIRTRNKHIKRHATDKSTYELNEYNAMPRRTILLMMMLYAN